MGGEGRGTQTHTNAPLQRFANHTLKYYQAARVKSRPLTVAKGYTLATRAAERTHCGRGNRTENAWRNNATLKNNAKNTTLTTQYNAKTQRNAMTQCNAKTQRNARTQCTTKMQRQR